MRRSWNPEEETSVSIRQAMEKQLWREKSRSFCIVARKRYFTPYECDWRNWDILPFPFHRWNFSLRSWSFYFSKYMVLSTLSTAGASDLTNNFRINLCIGIQPTFLHSSLRKCRILLSRNRTLASWLLPILLCHFKLIVNYNITIFITKVCLFVRIPQKIFCHVQLTNQLTSASHFPSILTNFLI